MTKNKRLAFVRLVWKDQFLSALGLEPFCCDGDEKIVSDCHRPYVDKIAPEQALGASSLTREKE